MLSTITATPVFEARWETMGTSAHVLTVGVGPEALEDARLEIARLEELWSRFLPESDVSRINAGAGRPVPVGPETLLLVALAVEGWRDTDGRYDPTVLDAVVAAGYGTSMAFRDPATRRIGTGRPAPGCSGVQVDFAAGTVRLPEGVGLDFGGIGKGLAADLVLNDLLEAEVWGACVNLGGDLRVTGVAPRGAGWTVTVEDPFGGPPRCHLHLDDGAVATSSVTKRAWGPASHREHHLIDPRTGLPADTRVASATVVTGDGWRAETLSKAALLAGPDLAPGLLARAGATGMLVLADGSTVAAPGWEVFLR